MRKILSAIVLICIGITGYSQQWGKGYIPHGRNIVDIYIKDFDEIQAIGGSLMNDSMEAIFRSNNVGLDWIFPNDMPTASWVVSIDYFTPQSAEGLTVGTNGKIKRTNNAGLDWYYIQSPINRDFRKVQFLTPSKVIVVGGRQIDTFQTVMRSLDAGVTWSVVRDVSGWKLNSVCFTDSMNGIAVGENGTILKTSNGGMNWIAISSPVADHLNEVTFTDALHGYIVGGVQTTNRVILQTVDGGNTWSVKMNEPGPWLNDVSFVNTQNGYAVGDNATIYQTTDGGANWDSIHIPISDPTDLFNTVQYFSPDFCMVGCYGYVYVLANPQTPIVQTKGYTLIDSTRAILSGELDSKNFPGNYTFYIDTNSDFSTPFFWYWPPSINTTASRLISGTFGDLAPNKTYYYFFKFANVMGSYYGDTLSFVTTQPTYSIQTWGANLNSNTSVTFQGQVSKMPSQVQLYIDYGTTDGLENTVAANIPMVNDQLTHAIATTVNNLTPHTTYYYRLRAESATQTYLGEIRSIYCGYPYTVLQTTAATNVAQTTATINGIGSGFIVSANMSFEYSDNPNWLNSNIVGNPSRITDGSTYIISAQLSGLTPGMTYYYRLRGDFSQSYGFTGATQSFKTGNYYSAFQTNNATNVTTEGAVLNGEINGVHIPLTISFEYGPTSAMINELPGTPSSIADTNFHTISTTLHGLSQNTTYYFRLKGVNGTQTYYGDTKTFFTGGSYIPNWDFQEWQTDSFEIPVGWMMLSPQYEQVAGKSGKAIKVFGQNMIFLGAIGDGFIPGQGLVGKPDSISLWLNYNIASGDTGFMLLAMSKGDSALVMDFHPIIGNTNNTFQQFIFPINYPPGSLLPDSLVIGFVTTNFNTMGAVSYPNNFIAMDEMTFIPAVDTIKNGNFENWVGVSIDRAISWSGTPIYYNPDGIGIRKVIHQAPDDYAVEISSVKFNNKFFSTDLSNDGNKMFGPYTHGYPVVTRHQTFDGVYMAFPVSGDTATISASFYKSGQNIGYAQMDITDTVDTYTPFSIPINYFNPTDIPDSASIFFRTSLKKMQATGSSKLIVDKLSFDGYIPNNIYPIRDKENRLNIYPNPLSGEEINIEWDTVLSSNTSITVFDIHGKSIVAQKVMAGTEKVTIHLENAANGIYIIKVTTNEMNQYYKIIKQ